MPASAIVSELMTLLQDILNESSDGDLCKLEERALDFGKRAAQLAMAQMLSSRENEPSVIECRCGEKEGIEAIAHLRSSLLNRRTDDILEVARIAA